MLDVFTGWESKNRYSVKNASGHTVFYAVELTDVVTMNVMGSSRPFEMLLMDNRGSHIFRVHRPYHYGCVCCGCADKIKVICSGSGRLLGSIEQAFKCCAPKFKVKDSSGKTVLFLTGPVCTCAFMDHDFVVTTLDGDTIGVVTRQFPGMFKEMFTKADVFGVEFPRDLDVSIKAVLLASTFLIDFLFYEKKQEDTEINKHRHHNQENNQGFGPGYQF